jgi:drug/metabolite transporter (DMT)-like permease
LPRGTLRYVASVEVTRAYLPLLLILGAIWGASFLFIEEAEKGLEPTTIMAGRLLLAAAILVPVLIASVGARESWRALRRIWVVGLISGLVNAALPFTLIAWGQTHIDSGTAAIANASMPLFVVLLALRVRRSESARGSRLVGVLLGFLGVGVLAGANPPGGWWEVAGTMAVVTAAFFYAVGALYAQHHIERVPVLVFSTAQCVAGTLVLLPFGLAQLPGEVPGWKAIGSVVALGVAGTAVGTLLYFRLVATHGSSRASLVVYLLPPFALIYGSTLLGESITAQKLIGLLLILGGVALGSGLVAWTKRPAPVPE